MKNPPALPPCLQVQVRHYGRPVRLDLDPSEHLRCAVVVFPRVASVLAAAKTSTLSGTKEAKQQGDEASSVVDLSGDIPVVDNASRIQHERDGGGSSQDGRAASNGGSSHHPESEEPRSLPSKRGCNIKPSREVPVRVIAVLVDGAGKGWLAARRLWSLREVGTEPLALAGLALRDVDLDQEASTNGLTGCCRSRGTDSSFREPFFVRSHRDRKLGYQGTATAEVISIARHECRGVICGGSVDIRQPTKLAVRSSRGLSAVAYLYAGYGL